MFCFVFSLLLFFISFLKLLAHLLPHSWTDRSITGEFFEVNTVSCHDHQWCHTLTASSSAHPEGSSTLFVCLRLYFLLPFVYHTAGPLGRSGLCELCLSRHCEAYYMSYARSLHAGLLGCFRVQAERVHCQQPLGRVSLHLSIQYLVHASMPCDQTHPLKCG